MTHRKFTDNLTRKQVSARTTAERRLGEPSETSRETPAAERLDAAGRLAAWFAHQINNPLGAISGNAQLLARRLQRDIGDPEALCAYLQYLEGIQSQTERCAFITGEAMNFTRQSDPELRRTDVKSSVEEAVGLIRGVFPESRIQADIPEGLPRVRADREWLVRVLFEVISNAVQASSGEAVTISAMAEGSAVRICVEDSGEGIEDEVLPRIFDPFFSTREKARGLGLTLSLDMMCKMRGGLRVERSNNKGCVFAIAVPIYGRQIER